MLGIGLDVARTILNSGADANASKSGLRTYMYALLLFWLIPGIIIDKRQQKYIDTRDKTHLVQLTTCWFLIHCLQTTSKMQ